MTEEYRAALIHALRMKRLNETLEAIRKDCVLIDRDIEQAIAEVKELEPCMTR